MVFEQERKNIHCAFAGKSEKMFMARVRVGLIERHLPRRNRCPELGEVSYVEESVDREGSCLPGGPSRGNPPGKPALHDSRQRVHAHPRDKENRGAMRKNRQVKKNGETQHLAGRLFLERNLGKIQGRYLKTQQ